MIVRSPGRIEKIEETPHDKREGGMLRNGNAPRDLSKLRAAAQKHGGEHLASVR
jgi:hypothetical protein